MRDNTILISQNTDDIPSDLRAYTVLTYGWKREEDRKNFKTLIKAAIADIENNPQKACSPVRKYLNQ